MGSLTLALAALGAATDLRRRGRRRWTACLLVVAGGAFALSFGPKLVVLGWSPYESLRARCPGFGAIRSPFRFAVFFQLGTILIAAAGVEALHRAARSARFRWRLRRLRRAPALAALAVASLATFEVWPAPSALYALPPPATHAGWVEWLRGHTPPGLPIVSLPPPADWREASCLETVLAMYDGLAHGRPLVNGYSGFFPPSATVQQAVMAAFPSRVCLETLARQGAIVYVVRRSAYPWPLRAPGLHLVFEDRATGRDIYDYEGSPGPASPTRGRPRQGLDPAAARPVPR